VTTFETRDLPEDDAGAKAADLMRKRSLASKALKAFKITVWVFIAVGLLAIAGFLYYAYTTHVGGYVTDERACSIDIGKKNIAGTRSYGYHYDEYLGFRFIDTRTISEQTKMQVRGAGYTVVNLYTDNTFDTTRVGQGEQGIQVLKAAERYVFIFEDGSIGMSDYKKLCK
jgi:hypothetical protein